MHSSAQLPIADIPMHIDEKFTPEIQEQIRKNFISFFSELEHFAEIFLTSKNKKFFDQLSEDCNEFISLTSIQKQNLTDFSQIVRQRIAEIRGPALVQQLISMQCDIVLKELDKVVASSYANSPIIKSDSKALQKIYHELPEKINNLSKPYELIIDRRILEHVSLLMAQLKAFHDKFGDERKNQHYFAEIQKIELGLLKLVYAKEKVDTDDVMMASILNTMTTQFKQIRDAKGGMEDLKAFLDAYDDAKKALKEISIFFKNMLAERHKNPLEGLDKFEQFLKETQRFNEEIKQHIENAVQFFKQEFLKSNNNSTKKPLTSAQTNIQSKESLIAMADSLGVAPVRVYSTAQIMKRVVAHHPVGSLFLTHNVYAALVASITNALETFNPALNEKLGTKENQVKVQTLFWGAMGVLCLGIVTYMAYRAWMRFGISEENIQELPKQEESRVEEIKDIETGHENNQKPSERDSLLNGQSQETPRGSRIGYGSVQQ